jgi:hypothetical protein
LTEKYRGTEMAIRALVVAFVAVTCVCLAALAHAQDADILGIVTDSSNAVLSGVTITTRNVETGLTRSTTTDDQGWYRIVALPVGRYELTAELSGFHRVVRRGTTLTVDARVNENFALRLASVEETVRVTGGITDPTAVHVRILRGVQRDRGVFEDVVDGCGVNTYSC